MLTDFQNIFSGRFLGKFAEKSLEETELLTINYKVSVATYLRCGEVLNGFLITKLWVYC